jgi:plastocyanin
MDVPRVRYEFGTRRVGNAPPVADAGPSQLNAAPGVITLNGSGSYDPLGLALTYAWTQISGPAVTLSDPAAVVTTFTAAGGQTYSFRLTVKNSEGLQASANTTVSTAGATTQVVQFGANPASIQAGQTTTLNWILSNATSASITPGVGAVDPKTGSVSVSPTETTTYTITANGASGSTTSSVTVTVGASGPQVLRFEASPVTIQPGQQTTLSWTTAGASTVSISGVGSVTPNGSTTVSPSQTTTYTLTATGADGKSVTAPVTVTVAVGQVPQIVTFVATPQNIDAGASTKLCWQVTGSTNITITPNVGSNLSPNDCATISPTQTTTYTLTANNAAGQIQANVTVNVGQVRILSFTSNPVFSTAAGSPVVLQWQTQNATSVVVVGNDISPQSGLPVNGSLTVNPISNATYTLTAYGPGGQQ